MNKKLSEECKSLRVTATYEQFEDDFLLHDLFTRAFVGKGSKEELDSEYETAANAILSENRSYDLVSFLKGVSSVAYDLMELDGDTFVKFRIRKPRTTNLLCFDCNGKTISFRDL